MENEHGVAAGSLRSCYRLAMTRIQSLDSSFTGLGDAGCLAQVRLEEDAVHAAPGKRQPHDTRVIFNMITDIREGHHTLLGQQLFQHGRACTPGWAEALRVKPERPHRVECLRKDHTLALLGLPSPNLVPPAVHCNFVPGRVDGS